MQFTQAIALFVALAGAASAAAAPPSDGQNGRILSTKVGEKTYFHSDKEVSPNDLGKRAELAKRFILPGFSCTPGAGQCTDNSGCYSCLGAPYICQDPSEGDCFTDPITI